LYGVSIEVAQEHFIDCAEKVLDAISPLRLPWRGEYKSYLQVGNHLFKIF
jgi:hypothetical protein